MSASPVMESEDEIAKLRVTIARLKRQKAFLLQACESTETYFANQNNSGLKQGAIFDVAIALRESR